ncbi:hypothetical protein K470DRAFT_261327 [Piedraia hortae CBS 480.64]|uniref:Mid2 domain-containing protein n=1 Tax=Piedraia hortae CBS 480.64 TaxID=1314780 RepID=A0A6A7CC15_9PEZI|nr:hypothetical protein K470DRAFT_261327 [Piedraia hortae CBS 480.64]
MDMRSIITLVLAAITLVAGQSCYNPDGSPALDSFPCSSEGGTCCPLNWVCLSNGMCYYPPDDFYGRYSCTSADWSGCQTTCTSNLTDVGNQAILKCSDSNDSWCCDHNRDASKPCCNDHGVSFFSLAPGRAVTTIHSGATVSVPASTTPSSGTNDPSTEGSAMNDPSTTNQATSASPTAASGGSTTLATPADSSPAPTTFQTTTQRRTTIDGSPTTVSVPVTIIVNSGMGNIKGSTSVSTSASASTTTGTSGGSNSSTSSSTILGLAIGITFALVVVGLLIYCLWRRRKAKAGRGNFLHFGKHKKDKLLEEKSDGYQVGHVAPEGRAPELDSTPVAKTINANKCELEGSTLSTPAMSATLAATFQQPRVPETPDDMWTERFPLNHERKVS